jgi:RecJ-like exonuclease
VKKDYPKKHPDRVKCPDCKGSGKGKRAKCSKCKGSGKLMKRAHLHAMLLATKLLLKGLWVVWNNYPPKESM